MFNEYEEFLTKKAYKIENVGFDTDDVHPRQTKKGCAIRRCRTICRKRKR